MPTDSGTNDILSLGFLHYTTAVSREMSDEPILFPDGYYMRVLVMVYLPHSGRIMIIFRHLKAL